MSFRSDIAKLVQLYGVGGFWQALRKIFQTLVWRYYPPLRAQAEYAALLQRQNVAWDAQMGVETCGDIPLATCGVPQPDTLRGNSTYRPVNHELFAEGISHVKENYADYSFVDYGSGMGKALMLAADYPFREIVGIEYAPGLHVVALRNLTRFSSPHQRCHNLRAELGDALTFKPPRHPLFCFFFNPFDHETLRGVILHLKSDWKSNPRSVFMLYVNSRNVKERLATFRAEPCLKAQYVDRHIAVFRFANP